MAETRSTMLPLGTTAPGFDLPDPSGKRVSLADYKDAPALLVAFICNHCPFVKHMRKEFAAFAKQYQARGVGIIAINSNDVENYPQDSPEKMAEEISWRAIRFLIFMTKVRRWRRLIAPPARRIFIYSIVSAGSFIGDSSMRAVRAMRVR
ncbi:MAG TPA: redoxin domain-containing protein [Terriglobales bacterium]|nr:redoxin domain-containing protein [Terriglobales bacterium]